MDNPFQSEHKPVPIKPFTAVDLAPPPQAKWPAGKAAPIGPGVSPFLDAYQSAAPEAQDFMPAAPQAQAAAYAPAPIPAPPAAARQSQILAVSDLPAAGSASTYKPRFLVSTTASAEGIPIEAYLGAVTAEIVVPKDLLFRNPAPYGELNRLKAAEDQLQKVKAKALEELSERARQLGADAVVGVSLDISSLDTVACLCSALGTAVKFAG